MSYERAAARTRLDDPKELERSQRFANGGARHLELLGELPLGWKLVARAEVALLEESLDLLDDALIEAAAADRLDDCQAPNLPERLLVRWSDQIDGQPTATRASRQLLGSA